MRFLPKRRIRVDIVTIFLALISVSCLIIIIYMYHKNYRGILDISKVMMQQLSLGVVEKISGITTQTQLVTGLARSNISQLSDISGDNHNLVRYLLNALKFSPFVTNINVASENGNFVSVGNLPLFGKHHYYFEPEHALPQGSKYSIRTIDSTAGTDRWEYLNTDLNTIAVESTPRIAYDPRITDWYAQVQIWPRWYWTRLYNDLLKESVLTFALPIYDDANQLIGAVSVDMALKQLENYISHQRIGLSGKAFILDEQGHVVIPELRLDQLMQIDPFLVKTAHETYVKSPQGTMLIQKGMEPYLCHVVDFPLSPETRWYIVTIVPFNDFVRTIIETQQHSVYISLAVLAVFCAVVYFASRHISTPIIQLAEEMEKIQKLEFEESKMKTSQIVEINKLQTSLSTMRKALRAFGCYVPKEIVHALLRQGEEISLGGERRDVSIMFSDMAHFTKVCEALSIEQLTTHLSEYFAVLSEIIIDSEGTIDKYIGDGIMALWGAPQGVSDHAYKACLATLRSAKICERAKKNAAFTWETRFGIHSGEAVIGNIGTRGRMNYTAIGNVVNAAARFQNTNKEYNTSIIISENVLERIGARFLTRPLDLVSVRGKRNKLAVYELVAAMEGDESICASAEQVELCEKFSEAYIAFHEGKFQEAKVLLLEIQKKYPSDGPTQVYLRRLHSA